MLYQQSDFREAAKHFGSYYTYHPGSDTALYYLHDCYRKLNQPKRAVKVLEQFVKIGSKDENVYLQLFNYYRRMSWHEDLYKFLLNLEPPITRALDRHCALTKRLYAEIISGATHKSVHPDPITFALSKGYIPLCPDNNFYDNDTITNGNLIIILDQLVKPIYPQKFFRMKNISNRSFLYLPYMRLVHLGIIEFVPEWDPDAKASAVDAAKAIANLKNRGYID